MVRYLARYEGLTGPFLSPTQLQRRPKNKKRHLFPNRIENDSGKGAARYFGWRLLYYSKIVRFIQPLFGVCRAYTLSASLLETGTDTLDQQFSNPLSPMS